MHLIVQKGGKENATEKPNSIRYGTRHTPRAVKVESGAVQEPK